MVITTRKTSNKKKWIKSTGVEPADFEKIKTMYMYIWIESLDGKIRLLRSGDEIDWAYVAKYMPKYN